MKTSIWVLTALCLTLLLGDAAPAAPISFQLAGTINGVVDPGALLPPEVVFGAPFSGRLTYELNAVDVDPSQEVGDYTQQPPLGDSGISININGRWFQSDPMAVFHISVRNDFLSGLYASEHDSAFLYSPLLLSAIPMDPAVVPHGQIEMVFSDSTDASFSSDALPTEWLLGDSAQMRFSVLIRADVGPASSFLGFGGTVESIEIVPEPSSLMLLGVGGTLLAASFGLARPRRHLS